MSIESWPVGLRKVLIKIFVLEKSFSQGLGEKRREEREGRKIKNSSTPRLSSAIRCGWSLIWYVRYFGVRLGDPHDNFLYLEILSTLNDGH